MPAGLIEKHQGMSARRDLFCDLVEMLLHGFGVCPGHDQGRAGAALRTDGAEEIGVFVALVLRLAWTAAGLGPLVDLAVLL